MECGCETWVINNAKRKKKLESFKMWSWRRMERTIWIERKTNEGVLRTVKGKRTPWMRLLQGVRKWLDIPRRAVQYNIIKYDRKKENYKTSSKFLYRTN